MKFLRVLSVALLFAGTISQAQITKGNWMVGGSGSFFSGHLKSETDNLNFYGFDLRPNVGYFIADKFGVGLTPLLTYSKTEGGSSVTNYGIGPYVRYYLLKPDKIVNVLTQVGYSYVGTSNSNKNSTAVDFKAGPVIYFNSSVAFEMTLNYNINNLSSDTRYNIFSVGMGFQIHLEK